MDFMTHLLFRGFESMYGWNWKLRYTRKQSTQSETAPNILDSQTCCLCINPCGYPLTNTPRSANSLPTLRSEYANSLSFAAPILHCSGPIPPNSTIRVRQLRPRDGDPIAPCRLDDLQSVSCRDSTCIVPMSCLGPQRLEYWV